MRLGCFRHILSRYLDHSDSICFFNEKILCIYCVFSKKLLLSQLSFSLEHRHLHGVRVICLRADTIITYMTTTIFFCFY